LVEQLYLVKRMIRSLRGVIALDLFSNFKRVYQPISFLTVN